MAKKVTMQQIADHLGVSKFVISKALSGKGGVSDATKERVIQAASQLGYFTQKNVLHKYMNTDTTEAVVVNGRQSVIVLMPNIRFQNKESLYWGRILDGISGSLEAAGLGMLIISEQSIDHFLDLFNPSRITGLIGVGVISSHVLLEAHRMGLAIVLVDHEDPLIPVDTVFVNNYDCMYRLTKNLVGNGHKRLCFVGNNQYSRSFLDRWTGFRAALEESGQDQVSRATHLVELLESPTVSYAEQIQNWLQEQKQNKTLPTAMVCANDSIAFDVVYALRELELRVPEDVTVTGFDNIDDSSRFDPPITTVHVPKENLGKRAVDKLIERLNRGQEPTEKLLLNGEIIYRGSSAGCKS